MDWLELAEITAGPLFRKVNRGGAVDLPMSVAEATSDPRSRAQAW